VTRPAKSRTAVPSPPQSELVEALDVAIGDEFVNQALTHRSYAYENGNLPTNERLEFLGDAVLGLVVTDALYRRYPDHPEGQLAKLRASVVNMRALADIARGIGPHGLGTWLLLGRGEEATGGRDKASILADTLEAVIGAAYLSCGADDAARLVLTLLGPLLDGTAPHTHGQDHKTSLQEMTAARLLGPPEYVVAEQGPDHAKVFSAEVLVGGQQLGTGSGRSKKEAEQSAAEQAVEALGMPAALPAPPVDD